MPLSKIQTAILKLLASHRPARMRGYQTHAGQRRGQWPSSTEISAAMFERYKKAPEP